jgi:hypothetical protein
MLSHARLRLRVRAPPAPVEPLTPRWARGRSDAAQLIHYASSAGRDLNCNKGEFTMDKYLEAAAAVNYRSQLKEKQHQTLVDTINDFMKAPLVFEEIPSQLIDSIYKIGRGQIDDRRECFAKVRGLFTSSMQSLFGEESSQGVFVTFEPILFEQIAYFEAAAFEYLDSGTMQIDDQTFNLSLKMLSALDSVTITEANNLPDKSNERASPISLITEYYKGADYLLASHFNRSHHRRDKSVRIGPFSFSTGSQWVEIERPALVLNTEQKRIFADRVWKKLSGCSYPSDPNLRSIMERIGSEPVAITAQV